MRLILSIDALHPPLTGIGWYTLELAEGLSALESVESLLFTDGRRYPMQLPDQNVAPGTVDVRASRVKARYRLLRPLYRLAGQILARRCGTRLQRLEDFVCHAPNYIIPRPGPRRRNTATIHDLSIFRHPELHPAERVRYMKKNVPVSIANCERLIVSSSAVKSELRETFNVAEDRVDVVPLGVRSVFCETADHRNDASIFTELGLTELRLNNAGYLLFVNGSDPRKNLTSALKAFRCYKQQQNSSLKLVVTAPGHSLHDLTARLSGTPDVVLVGYPDEIGLAALYRNAAGLLFPSLYEGFGLPVVEALAAGTPALISQADTLLEFERLPGVVSVDASDTQSFCCGIESLLGSAVAEAARDGAGAIAKNFSWQRCVDRTVESYARLL